MRNLVQVQKALGDRLGREVFIYSITVDPEHDTSAILKKYSEELGAKPGWSFLRGKVEDISALRQRLGLSGPSPKLSRKLNSISDEAIATGKTIETIAPENWQPNLINALVGDVVEWKLGAGMSGKHGVVITNWDQVKDYVEVDTITDHQEFDETTGRNKNSTDIPGRVLLRLKIVSDPRTPLKIMYKCKEYGDAMAGKVSVGQQHTGMIYFYNDDGDRKATVPIVNTPNDILTSIARVTPRQPARQ